jgi:aminoglycoside phosphotransferase (APT) family kinase protein
VQGPPIEVDVDAALVRALLEAQHPDLAHLNAVVTARGWDNTLVRLGDHLVARLPHRQAGVRLLLNEQRWLPQLAPGLPVDVPVPIRLGIPSDRFQWPWSIVEWIEGDRWFDAPPVDQAAAAADVGAFFRAVHRPAPPDAPINPFRGVSLSTRDEMTRRTLRELAERGGLELDVPAMQDAWTSALQVPEWDGPPVWLHGDMHPLNVLTRSGRLAAVIDFGDVCAGDPASDFVFVWMAFDSAQHSTLFEASGRHGQQADDLYARSRGWAITIATSILGSAGSDATFVKLATTTLNRALY